ncbi:MAG: hypothetical protein OXC10_10915 [Rhodospirillaceae bacterium]|nr:hypothetical protein [Rhodospirillaceae bacterium]
MAKLKCRVLLVEDDLEEKERCRRELDEVNQCVESLLEYELLVATTRGEAVEFLERNIVDCAILDLRIPSGKDEESRSHVGNEFLKMFLAERAVPVVVHSGYTAEISNEVQEYNVKTFEKIGGEYPEIFSWFESHAPLFRAMQAFRRRLMEETALIFQRSILPHWKESEEYLEGDNHLLKIVYRQIVAHLGEQLILPLYDAPGHHLHEVYFRPPLREDRLHTGDIVRYDDAIYVIVTPQCNIANDYPDFFLLAKCKGIEANVAKKNASKFANQNVSISEHFLPPCGEDGPWMVEFKTVRSVPKVEKDVLLDSRIASITPQFIPNLIQRFSAYLGRQGQPSLSADQLMIFLGRMG